MIGVDLFSGPGGMSVGAQSSGIEVRYAIERDIHAAATYRHNHPSSVSIIVADVRYVESIDIGYRFEPLILFGGPPCSGFSTSNQRTRNLDNQTNWLFKDYFRLADNLQPDWIVFENVTGLLETAKGFFFDRVINQFEERGYTISWMILNAADHGVPQKRMRLFIIASGNGKTFSISDFKKREIVSVESAIGDLPELENGASADTLPYKNSTPSNYALKLRGDRSSCSNHLVTRNSALVLERYNHVPCGGNWSEIPRELFSNYTDVERCHTGIYHRLDPSRPAKVIGNYRKNMLIHPFQNRGLSVREAARLQSFPDWFKFCGSIGFQQQQVGNAVPPLLAETVFSAIVKLG